MTKSVAAIAGGNRCHMLQHRSKETLPWGTAVHVASTYCQTYSRVAAGGVSRANRCTSMKPAFFYWRYIGRTSRPRKQFNLMSKELLKTLEDCLPRVVTHYLVGTWLMTSAECMGGLRTPTPQRCSAGCSVYRQCLLKGAAVKFNTTPKP
ncbi:hypothetical protein TNCV_946291 [Trichonephila clavipes]|nr:hypothetical protein TNCV_946291 [Trichonephila clavipes]